MASHNGKKSFGLRMLWIPGGRKSHPKGRYDSTNKLVPYSTKQKKSEVWSLGGSRAQNDLLRAEPDVSLLDGPSTSGIATLACATATGTAASVTASSNSTSAPQPPSTECLADETAQNNASSGEIRDHRPNTTTVTTPTTPDSTTSTALLLSAPQSPLTAVGDLEAIDSDSAIPSNVNTIMPAKAHQMAPPVPVIVKTTTTAQIMEDNRYSILDEQLNTHEFNLITMPLPYSNSLSGTTASQKSSMESPRKDHETSSTTESHDNHHNLNNGSLYNLPSKKKHQHPNHNNNQDNRFPVLGEQLTTHEFDLYPMGLPGAKDQEHLNSSSGTTASQKSSMESPRKDHETSSTTESHDNQHNLNNGSLNNSPTKKKHQHRNHNNNQGDVNSIESITEDTAGEKIPSGDVDWIKHAIQDRNNRDVLSKSKKKKKKKLSSAKELDQLDGVPTKVDENEETPKDEDEKVVKCLYYTLMCCDCTIS